MRKTGETKCIDGVPISFALLPSKIFSELFKVPVVSEVRNFKLTFQLKCAKRTRRQNGARRIPRRSGMRVNRFQRALLIG